MKPIWRANSTAGNDFDRGVVFRDRVVEEAPRRRELVLDVGEFGLQLLEIGVGLEVGIGLGEREQAPERARERALGGGLLGRAARGERGVARLDHRLERAALMRRVALHRLDEVRDEVVALLQLHVDVGKGLRDPLPQRDEAVVDDDGIEDDRDDDREKDPFHAASPCDRFAEAGNLTRGPRTRQAQGQRRSRARAISSRQAPASGRKSKRTVWRPGGTATARNRTFARRIGVSRPSTAANHHG